MATNLTIQDGDGSVSLTVSGGAATRTNISDDGSEVVSDVTDINFTTNLSASDDGDGSASVSSSGGGGDSWSLNSITDADSPYDASDNELVAADASSGAITINVPSPGADVQFAVKVTNATNDVTVSRSGTETIDGRSSDDVLSRDNVARTYISGGTDWLIRAFDPFQIPDQSKIVAWDNFGDPVLVGSSTNSGYGFSSGDPQITRNGSSVFSCDAPVGKLQFGNNMEFSLDGTGNSTDWGIASDGSAFFNLTDSTTFTLESTDETNDGMTNDPETATEDAFLSVSIGSNSYQIPLYDA